MGSRVPPAHSHGSGPGQHDGHPHLRLGGAHRHHHHPAHAAEGHHLDQVVRGGLPYHTTDKSLREHFEVYGEIEEAVVITDRSTGKSRGYGFVIMSNKEAAERACKEPNPIIDGRKANVNLAILGAKPRGNLTGNQLSIYFASKRRCSRDKMCPDLWMHSKGRVRLMHWEN